jgi:hypothetical protein
LITHTITLTELIWTALCAPGLGLTTRLFFKAGGDLVELKLRRINSIREFAAVTTMILYGCLTLVQFMFVVIGVFLMFIPNNAHPYSPGQYVVATAFITVSAIFDITLLVLEARRQELLRKIAEFEDFGNEVHHDTDLFVEPSTDTP